MAERPEKNISSSLEDYLEAIAEIIEANGHAHTKDIAEKLEVTMPSVSSALQSLSARGLINYRTHFPVKLTSLGAKRAAVIRLRHQALKRFFSELLQLDPEEADGAACRVEHVISETVMARMVSLYEAVNEREDCEGLRNYLAETMPRIQPDPEAELISLDTLAPGHKGVVVRIAENLRGLRKFADLGVVPGTLLQMEGRAPFGDLLRVKVMGSSLSLRGSDAMYIWIRPTE